MALQTETASEVLAQICLAFSAKHNRPLTNEDLFLDPQPEQEKVKNKWTVTPAGGLNMNVIRGIQNQIKAHVSFSNSQFQRDFVDFVARPLNPGAKITKTNGWWVEAQGKNMNYLCNKYKITTQHLIINDKIYGKGGQGPNNPYGVYLKTGNTSSTDKWNPADMWVMSKKGIKALQLFNSKFKTRRPSLEIVNQFIADKFRTRDILPISLKKPNSFPPHIDEINTGEFVQQLSLGRTNNPTIEFTPDNKDMKINFTIETVALPEGKQSLKEAARARRAQTVPGKVVKGSEKHIRIKYHVDNKKLELEYTQTKGASYAAAKMGNIGAKNFQRVINQTSRAGVKKLNAIQKDYEDIDIKQTPWFNGTQLGIAKARKSERELEPHTVRIGEYVEEIWNAIDKAPSNFRQKLKKGSDLWSKARAGEVGLAVGGIDNESAKKRVIQNLYELAAAISSTVGMTKEEMGADWLGAGFSNTMKTTFRASAYAKVY